MISEKAQVESARSAIWLVDSGRQRSVLRSLDTRCGKETSLERGLTGGLGRAVGCDFRGQGAVEADRQGEERASGAQGQEGGPAEGAGAEDLRPDPGAARVEKWGRGRNRGQDQRPHPPDGDSGAEQVAQRADPKGGVSEEEEEEHGSLAEGGAGWWKSPNGSTHSCSQAAGRHFEPLSDRDGGIQDQQTGDGQADP
ncbi:hypothetical protein OJ252_3289 [Cryptosporidium canis]|uniref:Uncharacterized protein n=1 Tax=Cryptosporidium canis TaxID=195482 RepID=A0ABQ8P2T0_9CRYT|nr:hypothetical protein OJ252_3289 [Cryptosporidium canis]